MKMRRSCGQPLAKYKMLQVRSRHPAAKWAWCDKVRRALGSKVSRRWRGCNDCDCWIFFGCSRLCCLQRRTASLTRWWRGALPGLDNHSSGRHWPAAILPQMRDDSFHLGGPGRADAFCVLHCQAFLNGPLISGNQQDGKNRAGCFSRGCEDQVIYPGPVFLASEDFAFKQQGAVCWGALTEGYLR